MIHMWSGTNRGWVWRAWSNLTCAPFSNCAPQFFHTTTNHYSPAFVTIYIIVNFYLTVQSFYSLTNKNIFKQYIWKFTPKVKFLRKLFFRKFAPNHENVTFFGNYWWFYYLLHLAIPPRTHSKIKTIARRRLAKNLVYTLYLLSRKLLNLYENICLRCR